MRLTPVPSYPIRVLYRPRVETRLLKSGRNARIGSFIIEKSLSLQWHNLLREDVEDLNKSLSTYTKHKIPFIENVWNPISWDYEQLSSNIFTMGASFFSYVNKIPTFDIKNIDLVEVVYPVTFSVIDGKETYEAGTYVKQKSTNVKYVNKLELTLPNLSQDKSASMIDVLNSTLGIQAVKYNNETYVAEQWELDYIAPKLFSINLTLSSS